MAITINIGEQASLRDVAGEYITEMGAMNDKMVIVNADLGGGCRVKGFMDKYPERSLNVGIAEQNMVSFAAGLAHEGYMPYCFTMAPFMSMRAGEQVRTDVCYGNLDVRLIGTYAGYSGGVAGATHCALEDCAIMGSFAGMTVLEPGDPYQYVKMLEATLSYKGPVYIRCGKEAVSPIYTSDVKYEIGKAMIPREGNDGAIIASGIVVSHAMEAAEIIEKETGAKIRVIDMHTIKPVDKEAVIAAAKTGRVIAAQDHNIIGGLGYYVGAVIAESGIGTQYKILGCPDHFVPIATAEYLFHINEYDTEGLVKNMKAMLEK